MLTAKVKKKKMYFDKTNKNNKYAICQFFGTNWPILLKKSSLSATLIIMLTTKCKTNLILDKTNKINSLQ